MPTQEENILTATYLNHWFTISAHSPQSTDGFLSNQPVNCIHFLSQAENSPSLVGQNEKPAGPGVKTTDPNSYCLSLSMSLSLCLLPICNPTISCPGNSTGYRSATCTVLAGQDESAWRGRCKSPISPHRRSS